MAGGPHKEGGCTALISAVAAGPTRIAIHGERTSDIKTLKLGPWIKGRILLADLSFYSHLSFEKIEEYGGYFVSRLRSVLPSLKGKRLDAGVQLSFRRRIYGGKRSGGTGTFHVLQSTTTRTAGIISTSRT